MEFVVVHLSSMPMTVLSLWMCVTRGISWWEVETVLLEMNVFMGLLLTAYVCLLSETPAAGSYRGEQPVSTQPLRSDPGSRSEVAESGRTSATPVRSRSRATTTAQVRGDPGSKSEIPRVPVPMAGVDTRTSEQSTRHEDDE